MPRYVALLRGIGPTNPNLSNEKLCGVLKNLGFTDVRSVLMSGNIVFESTARATAALESRIEAAIADQLGAKLDVIVRSEAELQAMLSSDPFDGAEHGKEWYLTVTFRKDDPKPVFSKVERAKMDGPEFMMGLERRHGKRITTRTWNTLQKIAAKMVAEGGTRTLKAEASPGGDGRSPGGATKRRPSRARPAK